jgi:hypothetical protein
MDIKTGTPADSGPQFCDLYLCREFDAMFEKIDEWPQRKGTWRRLLSSAPDETAYRKLPRWRLSKPKQICLEKVNDFGCLG